MYGEVLNERFPEFPSIVAVPLAPGNLKEVGRDEVLMWKAEGLAIM